MSRQFISIVPRLPPAVDGVGDYALNLAQRLRQDFGIETQFVVGDRTWTNTSKIQEFPIRSVSNPASHHLLSLLQDSGAATVLLHYVGYGYTKRGCPVWLVDGLTQWRRGDRDRRLVTMFHEVYASGPLWTSAFWLSSLQRKLAQRLVEVSDRCLTSKQLYAEILQNLSSNAHTQIPTLPVFSTVGEPASVSSLAARKRRLVVFGSRNRRLKVYQHALAELGTACEQLGIEEIWDIGIPTDLAPSEVQGVPLVVLGQQPSGEVSRIFLDCLAGFLNYPTDFLAKSTIFAAYCSHGLLPVSVQFTTQPVDGIAFKKHYWVPDGQVLELKDWEEMQAIADCAHTWYQTHRLSIQAKIFAAHLKEK